MLSSCDKSYSERDYEVSHPGSCEFWLRKSGNLRSLILNTEKLYWIFSGHVLNTTELYWIFSGHVLNTTEKSLLSKGLNFAIPPKNINYADYMLPF